MSENKSVTPVSQAKTIREIGDFWDAHSVADYWDEMEEVDFEIRVVPRHRVVVDPDVYLQIEEKARQRGIHPETLINLWLVERLQTA